MADAPTPQLADSQTTEETPRAPRVSILLSLVEGADLDAALAVVKRQAYEPAPSVLVIGDVGTKPEGVEVVDSLEDAIAGVESEVDYLWLLHSDARPRPDALAALVSEIERNEASLAGSKLLVAGTKDRLESVGSATDVFGEPYSGLEEGEIDLQQYDVVREVAFVRSASMLVRRDLAQGLKGLDLLLPPIAAGLDFSQRARLAGGRVISVPSSEVYHQGRCNEGRTDWREQAGRMRAMLIAYSPLTLLWVLPYDFLVSVLDSIASLLLLRWRPAVRHLFSWLWNLFHLPSTIGLRRRFRPVRAAGDEELFRFQARGSVRLREVGSELSGRILALFDEDQALMQRSRRLGTSPGIWGALVAILIVLVGIRGLVFAGVPDAGFSFPFERASVALDRWLAGWNDTGLGSPNAVHPSVGLTGIVSALLLGSEEAARTLLTVAFGFLGVLGMGRLGGRLGARGPGRFLAGLVVIAGPGTALLTGSGSWLALAAAAILPWVVRAAAAHPSEDTGALARYGWAAVGGLIIGSLSPVLAIAPLAAAIIWKAWGGRESRLALGLVAGAAGALASAAFVLGDPGWIFDVDRRLGLSIPALWPALVAIAVLPVAFLGPGERRMALVGGILSLGGMVAVQVPYGGPGIEEAGLVLASFGAALVVAGGVDVISVEPRRLVAVLPSLAVLVLSLGAIGDGRLGLAEGEVNERFAFASTLADDHGAGRILVASTDRGDIPGEARSGPGFWYRLVDGEQITTDEVWLAERRAGDDALLDVIETISTGSALRPGELLAPFAIDWVVLAGPEFQLDEALVAQLDLVPTPLDPGSRVFENPGADPLAETEGDAVWTRSGTGFEGEAGPGRVALAANHHDGWQPEPSAESWYVTVGADEGRADFTGPQQNAVLAWLVVGLLVGSVVLIVVGELRK